MVFFTADEHYGHKNILRYCSRPFKNTAQMDRHIIECHNEIVGPEDIVYHIGDLTMKGRNDYSYMEKIMNKLNGIHHLIAGNHDVFSMNAYLRMGFDSVHTSLRYTMKAGDVFMAHDPTLFHFIPEGKMLCGHVHGAWKRGDSGCVLNVGVDAWNMRPVSVVDASWELFAPAPTVTGKQ